MKTSEFEYYLIQELVNMPDRDLAKKIFDHIYGDCSHPNGKILQEYLDVLRVSDEPETFYEEAAKIAESASHTRNSGDMYDESVFASDSAQEGIRADAKEFA